jgi:CheY-like chemotaxis protein
MALDHSLIPQVVLVVEDEMLLRMRVVDMVQDAGYISVEAVDADDALGILQSRSDIALLFTDIQMPGSMNGLELAHAVHERWPPIKIILASGQLQLSSRDIPQDSRFFGKPLKADEMIAEMRDMLRDG